MINEISFFASWKNCSQLSIIEILLFKVLLLIYCYYRRKLLWYGFLCYIMLKSLSTYRKKSNAAFLIFLKIILWKRSSSSSNFRKFSQKFDQEMRNRFAMRYFLRKISQAMSCKTFRRTFVGKVCETQNCFLC